VLTRDYKAEFAFDFVIALARLLTLLI
jgi:hypothetical protein